MRLPSSKENSPMVQPSLEEVFFAEESPLLRYAFGLLGRRELAEEVVQDAFLKLHQHWDEVEIPRAWLFRCVRNFSFNILAKLWLTSLCPASSSLTTLTTSFNVE